MRDNGDVVGNSHSSENLMIRLGKWLEQQGGERGHTENMQSEKNYVFLIKTTKISLYKTLCEKVKKVIVHTPKILIRKLHNHCP